MHTLWTCESRSPLQLGYQDFWEVAEVNQLDALESLLLHWTELKQQLIPWTWILLFQTFNGLHVPELSVTFSEDCL